MVKEAATKTNDVAGDGTTTATVLAHAIMTEGMTHLGAGKNAISIKNGINNTNAAGDLWKLLRITNNAHKKIKTRYVFAI